MHGFELYWPVLSCQKTKKRKEHNEEGHLRSYQKSLLKEGREGGKKKEEKKRKKKRKKKRREREESNKSGDRTYGGRAYPACPPTVSCLDHSAGSKESASWQALMPRLGPTRSMGLGRGRKKGKKRERERESRKIEPAIEKEERRLKCAKIKVISCNE